MCGIAGFIYKDNKNVDKATIEKMTDAIAHRGPDAEGQFVEKNVGLGHRRLSIVDLSIDGRQPMESWDGRFVITFNGEIYNYLELKEELLDKGAKFTNKTDTEVIIEAYRYWGSGAFKRFNGMWAFCIYDRHEKKLIFSRDRFAVKPLYFLDDAEKIVFASEAKAILEVCPKERIPNNDMIYRFLSGVAEDRDELTFYKNIKNFERATYAVYDIRTRAWECNPYWEVDQKKFYDKWIKGRNPYKTCRYLLENAVGIRLRADVEVGACLSGGIDSSTIVGICSKKYKKKLHTFSSVYEGVAYNEKNYIDLVNFENSTVPHIFYPESLNEGFVDEFSKIVYYHDGPNGGPSLYSQYAVMKGTHGHVKVLLDGQGADELFAGYLSYYRSYLSDILRKKTSRSLVTGIRTIARFEREWFREINEMTMDEILLYYGKSFYEFLVQRFDKKEDKVDTDVVKRQGQMFTDEFLSQTNTEVYYKPYKLDGVLNTVLCKDIVRDSIPQLLHNEDGNSMAFSIETRLPFLDYRLVEFALALDSSYKIKGEWTKWILRKSCKKYMPKKVFRRKNKMGFPAPFERWLRTGEEKENYKNLIYAFGKRNIVPQQTIDEYYKLHMSGKYDYSIILYRFLVLELWLRGLDLDKKGTYPVKECSDFEEG